MEKKFEGNAVVEILNVNEEVNFTGNGEFHNHVTIETEKGNFVIKPPMKGHAQEIVEMAAAGHGHVGMVMFGLTCGGKGGKHIPMVEFVNLKNTEHKIEAEPV